MPVDPRFYASSGTLTLGKLAALTGADLDGDDTLAISGIASAAHARRGELAFVDGDGKAAPALSADLQAVVVNAANAKHIPPGVAKLIAPQPRYAHSRAAFALFQPRHLAWPGEARIDPSANVHSSAQISPGAVIGPGAAIGDRTRIGANAVIGPGVQIGRDCEIGAQVSVVCALIGNRVKLLAGARIGESGFGTMGGPNGQEDAPHFGRVILQDDVTVGANSCIDRGVFDDTILGERTKIDNLCQIAHNVVFGRSIVMAAFGGISGSVTIGNGARLGGRVGIAEHVKVGDRVNLAASAGLFRDVADGETWGGTPAKPLREWMRELIWLQNHANAKKSPKTGD